MKKLLSLVLLSTLAMSACSVDTSDEEADVPQRTDNIFKFEGLEVGQQYGDLKIENIAAFTSESAMSEGNLAVNFTGTTELTGSYEYKDSSHDLWPNQACFRVKGDDALAGLPVYMWFEDKNESFFCFENNDFAISKLGFENKDNVKIVIDDYTANVLEGEVVDWADLKEVK